MMLDSIHLLRNFLITQKASSKTFLGHCLTLSKINLWSLYLSHSSITIGANRSFISIDTWSHWICLMGQFFWTISRSGPMIAKPFQNLEQVSKV